MSPRAKAVCLWSDVGVGRRDAAADAGRCAGRGKTLRGGRLRTETASGPRDEESAAARSGCKGSWQAGPVTLGDGFALRVRVSMLVPGESDCVITT